MRLAGVHAAVAWLMMGGEQADRIRAVRLLRMPTSDPRKATPQRNGEVSSVREVRHTIIRVITAHQDDAEVSRAGLGFTGVVTDGGDFSHAMFSGNGKVSFEGAEFMAQSTSQPCSGRGRLQQTAFRGTVDFGGATFSGGTVDSASPPSRRRGHRLRLFSGGGLVIPSPAVDWRRRLPAAQSLHNATSPAATSISRHRVLVKVSCPRTLRLQGRLQRGHILRLRCCLWAGRPG
jgi:hypothetical protein